MAIIAPDIHGDPSLARAFLAYKSHEQHIALGDIVDSRKKLRFEEETECLEILLMSSAILLWGNHDLSYLPERPWECFGNFGVLAFREQFQAHRQRFVAAYAVDGWLLTHAGVSRHLAKRITPRAIAGGPADIATWLNLNFEEQIRARIPGKEQVRYGHGSLFNIPVCRGGSSEYGGIFWFDAAGEQSQPADVCPQIFGHSPVPLPVRGRTIPLYAGMGSKPWVNLHSTDGGFWVYDTVTDEIVNVIG